MSVRKRSWTTAKGEAKEAWIVTYTDAHADRVQETFARQKDAKAREAEIKVELGRGMRTARRKSITVEKAGELWLEAAKNRVERATYDHYRQHLVLHIVPHLGKLKLVDLSLAVVDSFETKVRQKVGRSTARKVLGSLGSILADARMRGDVAMNVVREMPRRKGENKIEQRQRGKLKVGVDIPTPDEIREILAAAQGRWKPFLLVAAFCGLRASELRGLRWSDVDFEKRELHVRQRADRYNTFGPPKSKAGERAVPIPRGTLNALREWKLGCPKDPEGKLDLVFPNGRGRVENHANICTRGLWPTEIASGVVTKVGRDRDGKPILRAKYTGLHALRHFYASWCINREADGGVELPLKTVQEQLGHASFAMTLDRYGHLFPSGGDGHELDAAEAGLLGAT